MVGSEPVACNTPVAATTWLVTVPGALEATFTVTVMAGKLEFPASASLRVHEDWRRVQVQPVPVIDTNVRLAGSISVTVTGRLVGRPPPLETVTLYCASICPCEKLEAFVKLTFSPISETGKLAVKEDAVESVLAKSLSMLEVYSTGPELWLLDWAVNMIVPVCPGDKDG